ncbi:Uncharacterised protein [Klebsiella pneumoniae subsp. rhinoscleromatis]|nr:Uncharacterised protein [Klebsiella pneumoniae subsp. rhinoscleromatis]
MPTIQPLTVHAVVVALLTHVLAGSNDKAHRVVGLFISCEDIIFWLEVWRVFSFRLATG